MNEAQQERLQEAMDKAALMEEEMKRLAMRKLGAVMAKMLAGSTRGYLWNWTFGHRSAREDAEWEASNRHRQGETKEAMDKLGGVISAWCRGNTLGFNITRKLNLIIIGTGRFSARKSF